MYFKEDATWFFSSSFWYLEMEIEVEVMTLFNFIVDHGEENWKNTYQNSDIRYVWVVLTRGFKFSTLKM